MRESRVPDHRKIATAGSPLIGPCSIGDSLGPRLLVKVDPVEGENSIRLLGRVLKPDDLSGDPPVGPPDEPFETMLALVHALNVRLLTEMARRPLGLNFHVEQVVVRICGSLGRPSRVASSSSALSHEWPFADNLSIGQGAEESVLELNAWSR